MSKDADLYQAALDATRLIAKEAGIRHTKAELPRLSRIQLMVVDAICACLPKNDPRRKDAGR
jgi:hypothetical protein